MAPMRSSRPALWFRTGRRSAPDGRTLYFANTHAGEIVAFDVDPATGETANRRPFASVAAEDGWPDGMTVDTEGFLWNAHWAGWRITRYDPEGKIERVIRFPVPQVSSCCFGGADMRTLFVTSATETMSEEDLGQGAALGLAVRPRHALPGNPRARLRWLGLVPTAPSTAS